MMRFFALAALLVAVSTAVDQRDDPTPESPNAKVETLIAAGEINEDGPAKAHALVTKTNLHIIGDQTHREGDGDNLPYPGMDYLGIGYDIVKGNPEGDEMTKIDPGFRPPVVELGWCQDDHCATRDLVHLTPISGWALPETSCNQAESSSTQSSMEDYQEDLAVAASVSASYEGGASAASASASAGFDNFKKTVVEKNQERYEMVSFCLKYVAGFKRGSRDITGIRPTKYFHDRVLQLPKLKKNACPPGDSGCVDMYNVGLQKFLSLECKNKAKNKASKLPVPVPPQPSGVQTPSETKRLLRRLLSTVTTVSHSDANTKPTGKDRHKKPSPTVVIKPKTLLDQEEEEEMECGDEGYALTFVDKSTLRTKWVWAEGMHATRSTLQHAETNQMLAVDPLTGNLLLAPAENTTYTWEKDDEKLSFSISYTPKVEALDLDATPEDASTPEDACKERKGATAGTAVWCKCNNGGKKFTGKEGCSQGSKAGCAWKEGVEDGKPGCVTTAAAGKKEAVPSRRRLLMSKKNDEQKTNADAKKPKKVKKLPPVKRFLIANVQEDEAAVKGEKKEEKKDAGVKVHLAEKMVRGTHEGNQQWTFRAVKDSFADPWMQLFKDFGTHYIEELHLGGKLTHLMTIESESKQEIEKTGTTVAAEVEGRYGPAKASVSAELAKNSEAENAFANAKKETKTIVLGGIPPESGADSAAGFSEWAASVTDHPMPVKYRFAPLFIADESMDEATYIRMRALYVSGLLKPKPGDLMANIAASKAAAANGESLVMPFELKPGEPGLSSGDATAEPPKPPDIIRDALGNTLQLTPECNLQIKSKKGAHQWQSMSWVWEVTKKKTTEVQECTLQYTKEGTLEILYGSIRVWHSNTDSKMCGGALAGKAVFKNGQLEIINQAGDTEWDTGTLEQGTGKKSARVAKPEHWGVGQNHCLLNVKKGKNKCVTLFTDWDYPKDPAMSEHFLPGDYPNAEMKKVKDGKTYSMRVSKDHCWMEQWDYDEYKHGHVWFLEDTPTIQSPGCKDDVCNGEECGGATKSSEATCWNGWNDGGNSMKVHSTSDWQVYQMYKKGQTFDKTEYVKTTQYLHMSTIDYGQNSDYKLHKSRKSECGGKTHACTDILVRYPPLEIPEDLLAAAANPWAGIAAATAAAAAAH